MQAFAQKKGPVKTQKIDFQSMNLPKNQEQPFVSKTTN